MTKRKLYIEEYTQRATKMPKMMEIEDNTDMDMDVSSDYHAERNAGISDYQSNVNRKFGYTLNQKAAKKKLLMGALKAPFEKEDKSTCLVLHFNDGSYFYSVLSIIEFWKKIYASGESIESDKYDIKVSEVKPGKEKDGMCIDTLIKFQMNGEKIVVHCYNTKAKILINGSGYSNFNSMYFEPYLTKVIGDNNVKIKNYNEAVTAKLSKL